MSCGTSIIDIGSFLWIETENRIKMAVKKNGKSAVTHIKVLERFKEYTLVEVNIETGRTHQ